MNDANFDRAPPPATHAIQPARQRRTPAIAMTQRDHFEVSRVHARRLNRRLIGFSAAVREEGFLQRAGRDLGQLFGERHHRLVGKAGGYVLQAVDLSFGARDDPRITVAHADGYDAAKEVEILLALDVPNMLHEAALDR